MSGAGAVNEAVRGATQARRWESRMQARAAVRRAGRLAVSKMSTDSAEPSVMDPSIEEAPVVTPAQRLMRRAVAVLTALIIVIIGGGLIFLTGVSGGKGYQVAPVLSLMMLVMFGFPAVAVLVRHVQGVWYETR
ncbi:MAG: hypothetical protein KUG77_27230 [Nannocystaceae bacterium]|nr:hypothetical protein [Nannocystaceae bacterium]